MNLPENPKPDGFGAVESENPEYWRALNELGKQERLPRRIWGKTYEENRQWSDRFIPEVKSICGGFIGDLLLEPACFQMDTERVSDLVLVRSRDLLIAVRIRRFGYAKRYPYDFTIRSKVRGGKTEWDKIIDGWGGWMFYGHADETEREIDRWFIIDLNAFRAGIMRDQTIAHAPDKPNGDGTWFKSFDVRKLNFTPSVLVGSSHPIPAVQLGLAL